MSVEFFNSDGNVSDPSSEFPAVRFQSSFAEVAIFGLQSFSNIAGASAKADRRRQETIHRTRPVASMR